MSFVREIVGEAVQEQKKPNSHLGIFLSAFPGIFLVMFWKKTFADGSETLN